MNNFNFLKCFFFFFLVTPLQLFSGILLLPAAPALIFPTSYAMVSTFPPCVCVQVWDDTLAKTAEGWAHACMWEHGPPHLLRFLGQNLSVRTGRWVTFDSATPPHLLLLSGMTLLPSVSSHGHWLCSSLLRLLSEPSFSLFFFCRSHDPSNKQKLCFQPWPMRAKMHLFSGSFLASRSETRGTLMCFTLLGFTEEWHETQGRSAQSS